MPKLIECIGSVRQQAPDFGEDTERVDGRDAIASSQRSEVRVMADREGVRHYDEATIRLARQCGNNTFKRAISSIGATIASMPKDTAAALKGFR